MVKKGFIGAIVLAVVLFGGVILGLMCTERIPAGYVGVVYNMNGGVDGEVLQQGWHLVSPTKNGSVLGGLRRKAPIIRGVQQNIG